MTPTLSAGTLIEFSFVSRLNAAMPAAVLTRLVGQAWRHNTEAGLTGALEIRDGRVRQVIEGDVAAVLPLASRILSDPRHTGIEVLAFGPIEARRHQGWRVRGLPAAPAEIPKASGSVVALCPAGSAPARSSEARIPRAGQA